MQINMHRPNSWAYTELGIHTLALVLKSSLTIARPDPKIDAQLQVTPAGSYKGGSIKVIVVCSLPLPYPYIAGLDILTSQLGWSS